MSRVALADIPSLIFHQGAQTKTRRAKTYPQLACIGKPCQLYTPEVVRCVNIGGEGTDVDWKCEADLPEALRFGRTEVSCEGWDGPGDPYVLKGSCSLEYRLVQVPDALRTNHQETHRLPSRLSRWYQRAASDPAGTVFTALWISALLLIVYAFLKSWFAQRSASSSSNSNSRPRPPPRRPGGGGNDGSGWFWGGGNNNSRNNRNNDPPPPYPGTRPAKPDNSTSSATNEGWTPGFWTGAAAGSLGTWLMNNNRRRTPPPSTFVPNMNSNPAYDWEYERVARAMHAAPAPPPNPPVRSTLFSSSRRPTYSNNNNDDRGEGSSGLGQMRRSVGFGGSKVR